MRLNLAICLVIICWASNATAEVSMDSLKKQGEAQGKGAAHFALEQVRQFPTESLTPTGPVEFDSKRASAQIKDGSIPQSEVAQFLESAELKSNRSNPHFSVDEYLFRRSEDIVQAAASSAIVDFHTDAAEYTIEACQEAGAPYPVSLTRTLQVAVRYEPEEKREVRHCLGHREELRFDSKKRAEGWKTKRSSQLSQDGTLTTYNVRLFRRGNSYLVEASWTHRDDIPNCTQFSTEVNAKPEVWEETSEQWVYDDPSLIENSKGPDCFLIETSCLDAEPRIIYGKSVIKQCWKEKLSFLWHFPKTTTCALLRDRNCEEVGRHCLRDSLQGCALWEISYRCLSRTVSRSIALGDRPFDLGPERIEYEPNHSFPDVYTKLALFEEIQKELEAQGSVDATKMQLFKGKKMTCSKNLADHLVYDCCGTFDGIANRVKLSQCSEEELSLGEMRAKGLCHYVGKYDERFLDLWKSRDEHVFCCFSSKLGRVFQEAARSQLNMAWGKPESPNCNGMLSDVIAKLDFSKIDLSEIYDKNGPELEQRLKEKLDAVPAKLKQRLKDEASNANG